MKNSKLRRILAVVIALAIVLTTCGLGTIVFAADADVVVNDGTDAATATMDTYNVTSADNTVTGGKAINFTKTDSAVGIKEATIKVDNISNLSKLTAISMYVEIPELAEDGTVNWVLGIDNAALVFQGDFYVINNDGELVGKNVTTLSSGFKGEIVYIMPSANQTLFKASKTITLMVNGRNQRITANQVVTFSNFIRLFTKISAIGVTVTNSAAMQDKTIVVDEITYHFETGDELLNEFDLKLDAPTLPASGRIAKGTELSITAPEGAEVYYTLDGSVPSATNGVKYSETKPVLSEECTVKAIAIKDNEKSLVAKASYTFFPENYPNSAVLNDGSSNIAQDSQFEGISAKSEFVDGYSPYGTAVKYTGMGTQGGQSMWNVTVKNQVEKSELADYAAFGMWVSVPYDFNIAFSPCINRQSHPFKGGCITYNTSTGEVKEYEDHTTAKLSNFEGYVLFIPKGECIGNNYSGNGYSSWKDFIGTNGLSSLTFFHSHSAYNGKTFVADNFVAVVDVDKFINDLKANETLRPTMPSATLPSGIVSNGEKIELVSNEGAEIYYTLDGTTPTTSSAKYSADNMPTITADNTTLKAIAVMNGITSGMNEYTYKFLDPSIPNEMIINEFEDTTTVYSVAGNPSTHYAEREVLSDVGYYNGAMSIKRTVSGAGLLTIKNTDTTTSKDVIAVKEAIAFWVSVPAGDNMSFNPTINGEPYPLNTTYTTYNTSTGEIKNYELGDKPVLNGFDGFVICDLKGNVVRNGFGTTEHLTWRNFINSNGLGKIEFYLAQGAYYNKTFVLDHMVLVNSKEEFINEIKQLPLKPLAPTADIPGGVVKKNEQISFIVQEGAEVYYTTDGTEPTNASTKYDENNKPAITEPCTIKAIAYIGEEKSAVTEYIYTFIDSSVPNAAVINDADDMSKITNWEGYNGSTSRRQVEGVSPYGKAVEITGTNSQNKGSLLNIKNIDTTDANTLAVKDSIAFWINAPIGKDINFSPRPNDEKHVLRCEKITYNTSTGETKTYTADEDVILNGFEGFVIYKLAGNCVRATYDNNGEYYTWRKFVTSNGLSQLTFYMNDLAFFNKTFTVDRFVIVTDTDAFLEEIKQLDSRPLAPISEIDGGIVSNGEQIPFVAPEGAEIYYTTDGSTPDKNSTKYDDANKPTITASPTTIKAVSYKEDTDLQYSLVTEYTFKFLDSSTPNSTVINDIDTMETVGYIDTYGERTERDHNNVMSMFGNALTITGINPVNTGSLMSFRNENTALTVDELAAHQAFAYWVSIPQGTTMNLNPKFNGEQFNIKAAVTTYNTNTGEIVEYEAGETVSLDGFEGFLIYKLEGECVRTTWSENSYVTWRKFVKSNGLKNITFYFNDKGIYRKTFTLDRFTMVVDVAKFLEELKALPKRPLAPTADPGSDAVRDNTQIFLHAATTGIRIVYTLDGTVPTVDAEGNITNGTLYTTYSMGNGQEDASYIELRQATTIKAIAVNLENQVSGVATFNYTIEPVYAGPNVVVINNGTGEGNNTWSWLSDAVFEREIVDNNSPDGKGIRATLIDPTQKSTVQEINFKVDTEGVEQIHNAQGFTFHLTVPDLGQDALKMGFGPRVSGAANYLKVDTYAISDDGETILKNVTTFNDFSGIVYCVIQEPVAVSMKYGSVDMEWYKFIKENSLTSFGFYYTCSKKAEGIDPALEYYFEFDELSLVYDTEQLFKDINLDGLLATYDAGTFENTNMIVTNDGSGNAKNVGLAGFTEGLVIEKTNYSLDERSLKLTMPKGESFINFMSTSTEEELIIGDGVAFWVEMPKGAGDTTLDLALHDNNAGVMELYDYADRWYYLIDKDGVIAKREGALVVPDGFRGWIVVPKVALFLTLADNFTIDNAELDFNQVSNVIVTFCNKNSELTGKTVHIDDISFYTDFTALVQSRAIKWEGQVFE